MMGRELSGRLVKPFNRGSTYYTHTMHGWGGYRWFNKAKGLILGLNLHMCLADCLPSCTGYTDTNRGGMKGRVKEAEANAANRKAVKLFW